MRPEIILSIFIINIIMVKENKLTRFTSRGAIDTAQESSPFQTGRFRTGAARVKMK